MCQPGVLSPEDACAWAKGRRIFTDGQLVSPRKDTHNLNTISSVCLVDQRPLHLRWRPAGEQSVPGPVTLRP